MLKRSTIIALSLLTVLGLLAAVASASRGPLVENSVVGGKLTYKPHTLILVADGTLEMNHIHWLRYGGSEARAKATAYVRNCTPNCAQGKVTRPPAKLRLSHRIQCHGVQVYTHISYVLSNPLPPDIRHRGSGVLLPPDC